ncbi:MAG: hypothetical protein WDM78_11555 [Puia sp.]
MARLGAKPHLHKYLGKDYTLRELSELSGVSASTIYQRLHYLKLDIEEALTKVHRRPRTFKPEKELDINVRVSSLSQKSFQELFEQN